jgi:hypothetical protein
VGQAGIAGDDFGKNILSREKLNRLYNAADLHLVPSRWEGGPQSAMEAAACGIKQLCPPIGVARDILEPCSLFCSVSEAAARIIEDIANSNLDSTIQPQWERWNKSHTTAKLAAELQKLYEGMPANEAFQSKVSTTPPSLISSAAQQLFFTIRRRTRQPALPSLVRWNHLPGRDSDLDEIMKSVRKMIEGLNIGVTNSNDASVEIAGWPIQDIKKPRRIFQWVTPSFPLSEILPGATLVAPSVQDVLNLRWADLLNPTVVLPMPLGGDENVESPLVVEQGDRFASLRVWRALQAGRPVIHPQGMAYAEQVFWAGLPYEKDAETAVAMIICEIAEFQKLLKFPDAKSAEQALRKLISC